MNCPRDHVALVPDSLKEIQVDRCPVCSGIWFDGGEMEHMVHSHRMKATDSSRGVADLPPPKDFIKLTPDPLTWRCPKDGSRLERVAYANDRGTAIEHCNTCQGWWFDRDDVDRTLELQVTESVAERVALLLFKEKKRLERESAEEIAALTDIMTSFSQIASPYGIFFVIAKILKYVVDNKVKD